MCSERTVPSSNRQPAVRSLLRLSAALLSILGILLSNGFHTFALQCYGWTQMFAAYNQVAPASEAFDLTFSGDDLCGVCILSQSTQKDLADSLALTLSEQKPFAQPTLSTSRKHPSAPSQSEPGAIPHLILHEIVIGLDPPPPRAVQTIA